jgi:hypothetical protein
MLLKKAIILYEKFHEDYVKLKDMKRDTKQEFEIAK